MLASDPDVKTIIRKSNFYMLAMREEIKFSFEENSSQEIEDGIFNFYLVCNNRDGSIITDTVTLDLNVIAQTFVNDIPDDFIIDYHPKMIRILDGGDFKNEEDRELIYWFTTEKLLYDFSHHLAGISGLHHYHDLSKYELLYVGIAKSADTYQRLFEKAHLARQQILSKEWPRSPESRVTDELYLFSFQINPIGIHSIDENNAPKEFAQRSWEPYEKQILADAEKAFVHLLNPDYNIQKFANYPKGTDGLWGSQYKRYGYVVAENFSLQTSHGEFVGSVDPLTGIVQSTADMILVAGEQVVLVKAPTAEVRGIRPNENGV